MNALEKRETMDEANKYPDISDILARKSDGREAASKKSFAEKIAIVEALNDRLAPLRAARLLRHKDSGEPISDRG
jgi:hypothetical protein